MHVVIAFVVGLIAGAGLLYAFRGYLAKEKDYVAAEAKSDLASISKRL